MTMSDADLEPQLQRQQAIWEGLYGPARAGEMIERVRQLASEDADRPFAELVAEVDPDDDDDWESGGLARPGVG